MLIHSPCVITPRLLPGVQIGQSFVSIDITGYTADNRAQYSILIDTPNGEFEVSDIRSGCGNASLQDGLSAFFSFLGACLESQPNGENANLFKPDVIAWAQEHAYEIDSLSVELSETNNLIEE